MRRPGIGQLGRALGGIPVERPQVSFILFHQYPQDLAKKGTGAIISINDRTITGFGTSFQTEVKVGDTLLVQDVSQINNILLNQISQELMVSSIISNEEIIYKSETSLENGTGLKLSFKIQPKVDQSSLFESVWTALKNDACIGIFPEVQFFIDFIKNQGGSHDQTDLLPLKPGICIMALGAMQKYKKKVYLLPVGLNYFKGHKFRSKVILEFGIPHEISQEILTLYDSNRREAISKLLINIEQVKMHQIKNVLVSKSCYYKCPQVFLPFSCHYHSLIVFARQKEDNCKGESAIAEEIFGGLKANGAPSGSKRTYGRSQIIQLQIEGFRSVGFFSNLTASKFIKQLRYQE